MLAEQDLLSQHYCHEIQSWGNHSLGSDGMDVTILFTELFDQQYIVHMYGKRTNVLPNPDELLAARGVPEQSAYGRLHLNECSLALTFNN